LERSFLFSQNLFHVSFNKIIGMNHLDKRIDLFVCSAHVKLYFI
jgi:hypothetical protein